MKNDNFTINKSPVTAPKRPHELEADIIKFQHKKEKWIAFVGLLNGRPYEIFTCINDENGDVFLPKYVEKGTIIKNEDENGEKRYDFQYMDELGNEMTIEGISQKFNPEYWNYAKLISCMLRYSIPVDQIFKLVDSLDLFNEIINTWENGILRALIKYIPDGTHANWLRCPICDQKTLVFESGCLICNNCGRASSD